mmetsp:Transcript_46444/g.116149  ORF Transcript_46444/g.116149 Transcript_46444/m.116149 type:complete len:159 (+) Transcript_46444:100-576(+)
MLATVARACHRGAAASASVGVGSALVPRGAAALGRRGASSHSDNTNFFIKEALVALGYPEKLQSLLMEPDRELQLNLAITRDTGEVNTFKAFRVQHNCSRGPYKGGECPPNSTTGALPPPHGAPCSTASLISLPTAAICQVCATIRTWTWTMSAPWPP